MISEQEIEAFEEKGFLVVKDVLSDTEVHQYRDIYQDFLEGKVDTKGLRSDLAGLDGSAKKSVERITQIMRPSLVHPQLNNSILHEKVISIAKSLLGDDMEVDFDMLIDKAPHTNTPTPWHQDAAYWIDMPDKRAASFWVALDDASVESGCMWYVEKSHISALREHKQLPGGGALTCKASEAEATPAPISAGDLIIHHGGTLHYSRGNSTDNHRRAFIINCRPKSMITYERQRGFDHLGKREVRN